MSNPTRDTVTNPWTREEMLRKLWAFRGNRALERAMVQLLLRQTADEIRSEHTNHSNGRGFSAFHAKTGTKLGKYARDGGTFGHVWQAKAYAVAKVHVGQLVEIANGGGS